MADTVTHEHFSDEDYVRLHKAHCFTADRLNATLFELVEERLINARLTLELEAVRKSETNLANAGGKLHDMLKLACEDGFNQRNSRSDMKEFQKALITRAFRMQEEMYNDNT